MKGYVQDIKSIASGNNDFRRVLYTARNCQLVVMSLKPQEDIGAEVHKLDQFFRVEAGCGEAEIDGVRTSIQAGHAVIVPASARHNSINTGSEPLKFYTLPPWQQRLGSAIHLALYALMLAMPILGWRLLSAAGKPVPFFGARLPALLTESKDLAEQLNEVHETIGTIGYLLIGSHALAALFHHDVTRDNTLLGMLPGKA